MTEKVTTCVECGVQVSYSTKKPKWCKKCKKKQPKTYKPSKRTIPTRSKEEAQMQYALNLIFPEASYIDGGYYSFLPSPKGAPLQLDRYYPRLKLAFEYDGAQHTSFNPFIHKTQEAFNYLQECDRLKNELCEKHGIRLIRIRHDKKVTKGYLVGRLKEEGLLEEMKQRTHVSEDYSY